MTLRQVNSQNLFFESLENKDSSWNHAIVIGAQKSATSWLYWNLFFHPETKLPPLKELNYFNFYEDSKALKNALSDEFTRALAWQISKRIETRENFNLSWYHQYLQGSMGVHHYESLFKDHNGQLTADISPAYATMNPEKIRRLYQFCPHASIIYLLRHPIQRAISALNRMNLQKEYSFHETYEIALDHSKYGRNLDNFIKNTKKENLHIFFYEDLQYNASKFFSEICKVLNISPIIDFNYNKIRDIVYKGEPSMEITPQIRKNLARDLLEDVRLLNSIISNNYTTRWIREIEIMAD